MSYNQQHTQKTARHASFLLSAHANECSHCSRAHSAIGELATLLKRGPYPPYLHLFRAHVVWFSITTAFAH